MFVALEAIVSRSCVHFGFYDVFSVTLRAPSPIPLPPLINGFVCVLVSVFPVLRGVWYLGGRFLGNDLQDVSVERA